MVLQREQQVGRIKHSVSGKQGIIFFVGNGLKALFRPTVVVVGWVEAIAETHHIHSLPIDGFRCALPILRGIERAFVQSKKTNQIPNANAALAEKGGKAGGRKARHFACRVH